jgi:hypothetical protein
MYLYKIFLLVHRFIAGSKSQKTQKKIIKRNKEKISMHTTTPNEKHLLDIWDSGDPQTLEL